MKINSPEELAVKRAVKQRNETKRSRHCLKIKSGRTQDITDLNTAEKKKKIGKHMSLAKGLGSVARRNENVLQFLPKKCRNLNATDAQIILIIKGKR